MPERTILSHDELHMLAKVAAVVYEGGLLDPDATSHEVVDLCRRCSKAIARGEVLAIAHPEMTLMTALANGGVSGRSPDA